jgi:preprotein translocase subunit YajC
MQNPIIILVIVLAVIVILFLIWRNNKDKSDNDPELTEELERKGSQGEEIK